MHPTHNPGARSYQITYQSYAIDSATRRITLRNDHVGHRLDLSSTIDQVRWSGLCRSGNMMLDRDIDENQKNERG